MGRFGWRHFARKTPDWWDPPPPGPFVKQQLNTIRKFLTERGPQRVLEIGVGRGRATPRLQGDWSYLGLDVNDELLAEAKRLVSGPFIVATATALPLKDQTFDVVVAFDVFMHVWERIAFLRECRRVLTPDGLLVINYLRRLSRGWRQYLLAYLIHPARTWQARDRRFDSERNVQAILVQAGFEPQVFMGDTSVPFVRARRT